MKFGVIVLATTLIVRGASVDQLLDRTSRAAEREATFLASVACTESIVEAKLGPKNNNQSQSKRLFDYFVLVDTADGDLSVNESRIEQTKGGKGNKQLLQSTGFALLALIFHPFFQQSFTMTEGETESSDGRQWHKIMFQYRPGKRSPTLFRTGAREYGVSWAGYAWVDEPTGLIGRIHARADAQLDEIGIKTMEADVRYGPVGNLNDSTGWVPLEAVLDLQTGHQHWRNTHTFSKFRRFGVSAEEKRGDPK